MATIHIESKIRDISENVIMPGDPLRAKYIANNYLENAILVNKIRNNLAYTGYYKKKKVTVFASGMGFPSMGIYAYELFNYYNVKNIIRIGTAGSNQKDIKIGDIVLGESVATVSNFAETYDGTKDKLLPNSIYLNNKILETAKLKNINIHYGTIMSNEIFDLHVKDNKINALAPQCSYLANEMEAFALIFLARKFNKKATTLLTISDSIHYKNKLSALERENKLDEMIILALETIASL